MGSFRALDLPSVAAAQEYSGSHGGVVMTDGSHFAVVPEDMLGNFPGWRPVDAQFAAEFEESEHPRADDGKFSDKGGGGSGGNKPKVREAFSEPGSFNRGMAALENKERIKKEAAAAAPKKSAAQMAADKFAQFQPKEKAAAPVEKKTPAAPAAKKSSRYVGPQDDWVTMSVPLGDDDSDEADWFAFNRATRKSIAVGSHDEAKKLVHENSRAAELRDQRKAAGAKLAEIRRGFSEWWGSASPAQRERIKQAAGVESDDIGLFTESYSPDEQELIERAWAESRPAR